MEGSPKVMNGEGSFPAKSEKEGLWGKREVEMGVMRWRGLSGPFKEIFKIFNWPPKFHEI